MWLNVSEALHIAIIGAGLIGLSCADQFITRGVNVTVLETLDMPVGGASFANSGMIHPSQAQSWSPDLPQDIAASKSVYSLAVQSQTLIAQTMKRLGLREMMARPQGCLQLFADLQTARLRAKSYAQLGVNCKTVIDSRLSLGLPAVLFPDDISGNARDYGLALAEDLTQRGVEFVYGVNDLRLRKNARGVAISYGDTRLQPDHVIVAAGAKSPNVLKLIDISMSLKRVKGHALTFARPDMTVPDLPIMDAQSRSAMTVFRDTIRLSGGWGVDDFEPVMDRWREIAPAIILALGDPISRWSADRPVSNAGRPYISPTTVPGLWVNTGHGHMGWTLCAGSGQLMADMILEGRKDPRFAFAG